MKKRRCRKHYPEDDDALGDVNRDAQRDCKSEKEKAKFD